MSTEFNITLKSPDVGFFIPTGTWAMSLLQTRDYLTEELKSKLRQSYYPEESIESAINYINKYGYLDDRRYVYNYFHFKSANKSRKVLELKLIQKGADLALIKEIADEFYEDNDIGKTVMM